MHSIATDSAAREPFRCGNLHRIRARPPHVFTGPPIVALLTRAGSRATKDGDSISTLLYVLGGWFCVSLLAYLLLLPMLRMSRGGDSTARPRGLAAPATSGVPSPQRLGYSGIILERLAQHTRTVIGVHEAWIAITPPGEQRAHTVVAAAGTDPEVIGMRVARPRAELGGLASAPVMMHGHLRGALCVGAHATGGGLDPAATWTCSRSSRR